MNDVLNEDWIDALLDDTDLPDLDLYDDSAPLNLPRMSEVTGHE